MFRSVMNTVINSSYKGSSLDAVDKGLSFNGDNFRLDAGSEATLGGVFTSGAGSIVMWIKPSSDGENDDGTIISKGTWSLKTTSQISSLMKLKFTHNYATTNGVWEQSHYTPSLTSTGYRHLVLSFDASSGDLNMYIDGYADLGPDGTNQMAETSTPSGLASSDATSRMAIGAENLLGTDCFHGEISDLAIYKQAFTHDEAIELENGGLLYDHLAGDFNTSLKAWWRMGDGPEGEEGNIIYDMSSYGHDATGNGNEYVDGIHGREN